jgi:hypothetical protein
MVARSEGVAQKMLGMCDAVIHDSHNTIYNGINNNKHIVQIVTGTKIWHMVKIGMSKMKIGTIHIGIGQGMNQIRIIIRVVLRYMVKIGIRQQVIGIGQIGMSRIDMNSDARSHVRERQQ